MSAHRALQDDLIADAVLVDPGTGQKINPDRDFAFLPLTTTGAQTRILGPPNKAGQLVTIAMNVDGGDCTVTQTGSAAINEAGNTTVTFDDPGERCTFIAILLAGALVWRVFSFDGATFS